MFSRLLGGSCSTIGLGLLVTERKQKTIRCNDKDPPHPPFLPRHHKSMFGSWDVGSMRRGYEVYTQVCSTCHSMKGVSFKSMSNTLYPDRRVKQLAEQYEITSGPNMQGEMFQRPGKPIDKMPSPYPNKEAARFSNNGAEPPDFHYIAGTKEYGDDYIYGILIGYKDPPLGVSVRAGIYYNTYFPGNIISMPPPITEDYQIEYEDGTPATCSQMAKDVSEYLCFTFRPQHDDIKLWALQGIATCMVWFGFVVVWMRYAHNTFKVARFDFTKVKM